MRVWLTIRYRLLDKRYGELVIEEINGLPIVILPEVFNPVLLRSGEFLAQFADTSDLRPGTSVLDLGTGSGVVAIFAAKRGASVCAVDINPASVRCAKINALLNQVEDKITVMQGDLFAPVEGQRFDVIFFNPPFHLGKPKNDQEKAWRGLGVFESFSSGLAGILAENGRAFVLISSDGDGEILLEHLANQGYSMTVAASKDYINEIMAVYEIRPMASPLVGEQ